METVQDVVVGDYVRSFDFSHKRNLIGADAYYIEGFVEGYDYKEGCDRYRIKVKKVVIGGKIFEVEDAANVMFPPVNGMVQTFSNDLTNFVEKI